MHPSLEEYESLEKELNEKDFGKIPSKLENLFNKKKIQKAEFERANNFTLASLILLQQNLFNRDLRSLSQRHKDLLDQLKEERKINDRSTAKVFQYFAISLNDYEVREINKIDHRSISLCEHLSQPNKIDHRSISLCQ